MHASETPIEPLLQGYIFGPIIDDRFKGKEKIAQSAVDQATPSTSETSVEIKQ